MLRLHTRLLARIRPRLIILQPLDKLTVYTQRPGDDRHLVLRKRSGLVRADDGGVRHRLAGAEHAYEQVLLRHALRSEREGKRHRERQP